MPLPQTAQAPPTINFQYFSCHITLSDSAEQELMYWLQHTVQGDDSPNQDADLSELCRQLLAILSATCRRSAAQDMQVRMASTPDERLIEFSLRLHCLRSPAPDCLRLLRQVEAMPLLRHCRVQHGRDTLRLSCSLPKGNPYNGRLSHSI